jgi:ABC-type transporter Mla subunit MlaD
MNESLNTILGQLEEDLKKLQSAREQVESVVESNQEFATTVNDLVTNTESLVNEIKIATEGAIEQFSEKLNDSKNAVDKVVSDCISRVESSVKKSETANIKLKETAETKITEVSKIATQSIEEQKENAEKKISDVSIIAATTIGEQKSENLKVLNQILETHNHIKQLIGQLLDLELPATLKSINKNLEQIQEKNDKQFKTLKTIGIVGLVLLICITGIITVFKFVI